MVPSSSLERTFSTSWNELLQELVEASFYAEMIAVGGALSVAYLLALLIKRYAVSALRRRPGLQNGIAHELSALTVLLWPLMSVVVLSSVRPLTAKWLGVDSVPWVTAASDLAVTWLIARIVLLVVKTRPVAWFITLVLFCYALLTVSGFMQSTTAYFASLSFEIGKFNLSMLGIIKGLIIFVIVFWLARSLSMLLEKQLRRATALSYNSRELITKFFTVIVYFIAFVTTLGAMGVDLTALAVFGGAMGVGVGLGLQKITANFVSGVTLLLEKSIKIGDLIEIDGQNGTVRQLHMRYALIETADGREILFPNEQLISSRVTNWTYSNDLARIDIRLVLDHDADVRRAQAIMLAAAKAHPLCQRTPEPHCWVREFIDQGVVLLLVFWIPDIREGRNTPQSDVMLAILDAFRAEGITVFRAPKAA